MYCSGVTLGLQWYLHDTRTAVAGLPDITLHVEVGPGRGRVGCRAAGCLGPGLHRPGGPGGEWRRPSLPQVVLDDGLDREHPDLAANYDPGIRWSCSSTGTTF
jgi:hypothetical protein